MDSDISAISDDLIDALIGKSGGKGRNSSGAKKTKEKPKPKKKTEEKKRRKKNIFIDDEAEESGAEANENERESGDEERVIDEEHYEVDDNGDMRVDSDDDSEAEMLNEEDVVAENRALDAQISALANKETMGLAKLVGRPRANANRSLAAALEVAAVKEKYKRLKKSKHIPVEEEEVEENEDSVFHDDEAEEVEEGEEDEMEEEDGENEEEKSNKKRKKPSPRKTNALNSKQFVQSKLSASRLAPPVNAGIPAPNSGVRPAVLNMTSNKSGQPVVVGTRVKIGDNVWRCTYRGVSVPYEKRPEAEKIDLGPECFSTFFNETEPTTKFEGREIPSYDVFVVSTKSTVNPVKVSKAMAKRVEGNLEKVQGAYREWINRLVSNKNREENKATGSYRMFTTNASYIDKVSKINKINTKKAAEAAAAAKQEQAKTPLPAAKTPTASSAAKSAVKGKEKEKDAEEKSTPSSSAPRSNLFGVHKSTEFLYDDKWVHEMFAPAITEMVKSTTGEELRAQMMSVHSTFREINERHKNDSDQMNAFNAAREQLGEHIIDLACMLPFMFDSFRRMVEQKILADQCQPAAAAPPKEKAATPAPASSAKKASAQTQEKSQTWTCAACEMVMESMSIKLCLGCETPRDHKPSTASTTFMSIAATASAEATKAFESMPNPIPVPESEESKEEENKFEPQPSADEFSDFI